MTSSRTSSSPAATVTGLVLAATGLAHFVRPSAFVELTRLPHPDDTAVWVRRDGAAETVIGAAVALPRTRTLGWVALAAYAGSIVVFALRNNR